MAHFDLGKVTVSPKASEALNELGLEAGSLIKKHHMQNFEPMPNYAFLEGDQMYVKDMEKNTQVISRKHGRIFSYIKYQKTEFYIFTSLRIGRSEGTLLCLPKE